MPSEREIVERYISKRRGRRRAQLEVYLALGYLRCRYWDRVFAAEEQGALDCSCVADGAGVLGTFSEPEIWDVEEHVETTLAAWEAESARRARRRDRWAEIFHGVIGAFLYSFILVGVYLIWEYQDNIPWLK